MPTIKMLKSRTLFRLCAIVCAFLLSQVNSESNAQRRPFQIGGSQGVVIGGGMGLRIGGRNGVQFGGGQGARFGPPQTGVQFGGGQGARFGPTQTGVQFGGGQGAKFGALQFGGQANNPSAVNGMTGGQSGGPTTAQVGQANRKVLRLDANASQPVRY